MVLSEDPLTTSLSLYWRQAMPRLWPLSVRTNSHVLVLHTCKHSKKVFHLHHHTTATNHPSLNPRPPTDHSRPLTFMVLSPDADTMYLSSKSTTLTAARWPTSTRRRLMSVADAMSHTAMERSFEHVTMRPFQKRRCRTASLWWIRVLRTSPETTSHTLRETENKYCRLVHIMKGTWAHNSCKGGYYW